MVRIYRGAMVAAMMGGILSCFINPAWAHEKREVAGKYEFVVGFVNEPAFSGQMNGVDLRIKTLGSFSQPVEGIQDGLTITVTSPLAEGDAMVPVLRTRYKDPGRYAAYFLPTRAGQYIFRIQGNINGIEVDEVFKSGEGFHDVEDSSALHFPQVSQ